MRYIIITNSRNYTRSGILLKYEYLIISVKVCYPEGNYFPVKAIICPRRTIIFQQEDKKENNFQRVIKKQMKNHMTIKTSIFI